MKNKSIFSIWHTVPGSSKKNLTVGLGIAALFVVSFVEARNVNEKGTLQQGTVGRQPQPAGQQLQSVSKTRFNTPQAVAGVIDAERWKNIQAFLRKMFKEQTPSKMLENIRKIEQQNLTDDQMTWLDDFKDKVELYAKLQNQQSQAMPLMQLQQAQAGEVVPRKGQQSGWFGNLWDYESSLAQYLPTTALGGAVAGLATYFAAPVVAGYLSLGLAAQLGAAALGVDRIFYAYNTGALTESGAVDALKELLNKELADQGRYPTLASKAEALSNNEFPGIRDKDPRIVTLALQSLRKEIGQTLNELKLNLDRSQDLAQENMIVTIVDQLRNKFGFIDNKNIEMYIARLETPKDFIDTNMTDANAVAMMRAICSELLRMKSRVAIAKGEAEVKNKPLSKSMDDVILETSPKTTYQSPVSKKAQDLWKWMTSVQENTTEPVTTGTTTEPVVNK